MIDFNDLDDGLTASTTTKRLTADDVRAAAHITNGGDNLVATCPKCQGRGFVVIGYTNRRNAECFGCKGKGKISNRSAGAIKAKATRAANFADWTNDNAGLLEALRGMADWNNFAREMVAIVADGRLLTENQLAACQRMLAKVEATRAAKREARIAAAPAVTLDAVHALFTKATDNGLKRPIFRGENLTVKMARRHEGVLYVTDTKSDEYLGKVVNGRFQSTRAATEATTAELRLICENPEKALFNYSRSTATYDDAGNIISCGCGICGKELTDPVSIARGIGPVCAGGFGL